VGREGSGGNCVMKVECVRGIEQMVGRKVVRELCVDSRLC